MKDGKVVYCTADDTVNPVGSDSKAGKMSPRNLWVTTIGDELRLATNNRSKVIGVALKDRASILPAGHHANGAFWFDDKSGKFITSTFYMDKLPEWVNKFNKQKLPNKYLSKKWETLYPIDSYKESTRDDNNYENGIVEGERQYCHSICLPYIKAWLQDSPQYPIRLQPDLRYCQGCHRG